MTIESKINFLKQPTTNNKKQIMRHPFELELSELAHIDFAIQELSDETSEQVSGGGDFTTAALGEIGEDGKGPIISQSLDETGEDPPTSGPYGIMEGGGCVIIPPKK